MVEENTIKLEDDITRFKDEIDTQEELNDKLKKRKTTF